MEGEKIKYTNQRVEILNFLKGNKSHPSVEEVYEEVRKKLTRISRATVYQNLRFLAGKGLIREVNVKGVSRFEPNLKPHHHIICRKCGRIFDFESEDLTEYALKVAKRAKDFRIVAANTNFYGTCRRCRNAGNR